MLSTKHVVLGLVIERPGYGYDLQQRLGRRFGFLGLSDRAVYCAATPAGREELGSNRYPVSDERRRSVRLRIAVVLGWLVIGGVIAGQLFGDVGILAVLISAGLIDYLVKLFAAHIYGDSKTVHRRKLRS